MKRSKSYILRWTQTETEQGWQIVDQRSGKSFGTIYKRIGLAAKRCRALNVIAFPKRKTA